MSNNLLEVKNLVIDYPLKKGKLRAVDNVSFNLKPGDSLGLVGESGCGKTTMGLSLIKLLRGGEISSGEIVFEGENIAPYNESKMNKIRGDKISMVFQASQNALNPLQKILDHFIDTYKAHDNWNDDKIQEIEKLVERLEISKSRLKDYPFQFSGGMQQRIVIALSLLLNPKLLIADEPTTALDVLVQAKILRLLKELKEEFNLSMIFISHDLGVVSEVTQRVAIMYAGQIVEIGDTKEIFQKPLHPYTEGLIRAIPNVHDKEKTKQAFIPGTPPDLRRKLVGCRFAPRCTYRKDICLKEEPQLIPLPTNPTKTQHLMRCLRYNVNF